MAQVSGDCELNTCPLQVPKTNNLLSKELEAQLARAYALQSQSDFRVYRLLMQSAGLPESDLPGVEECHSHVVFAGFVQNLLKAPEIKSRFRGKDAKRRHLERYARSLAREIEKLAPAVDRGQTPANVEYPWIEGETVSVPCQFSFTSLSKLKDRDGLEFLKLIDIAITDYEKIRLSG